MSGNKKIGLYTDPHFSQSSSIIVGRRGEFTGRLSNLISSYEWMDKLFKEEKVDYVVCLGDVTDKPVLTSEEITAMSRCPGLEAHKIILGNHCRSDKDGRINSVANYDTIDSPQWVDKDAGIYALPYNHDIVELKNIEPKPRVILSHNDIKGYDLGGHISEEGYEIGDILENCELFINGHLHNGGWVVKDRVMNLGNLSGMNFSSCGGEWEPSVAILSINGNESSLQRYENPYAYRFKKEEFKTLTKLKGYLDNLPEVGQYVLQVKVPDNLAQKSRKLLEQCDKVVASRILTYRKTTSAKKDQGKVNLNSDSKDVYTKLKEFINSQKPKYSLDTINKIIDKISQESEGAE